MFGDCWIIGCGIVSDCVWFGVLIVLFPFRLFYMCLPGSGLDIVIVLFVFLIGGCVDCIPCVYYV